ncbi:MAG: hypothetical protein H6659_17170 [Ardenticatenaceae bacterium]|nr:hypothetical protein [Ardenticatenaceae bacterium]MCB8987301.1 hypothetical protein [Ardenticatenaceae bacterium]
MIDIKVGAGWRQAHPAAHIGVLLVDQVDNSRRPTPLDEHKKALTATLRAQYGGWSRADLLTLPVLQIYRQYYKRFKKTYHVQLQLESVLHRGKELPTVNPLVDAAFAAEMETLILTASHDVACLEPPLLIDSVGEGEVFTAMNGEEQPLKAGDMAMRDAHGAICTIIYGQDQRSPITPATRRALYVAYVPAGIEVTAVTHHLQTIARNVRLFAPTAVTEMLHVYTAV